MTHLTLDSVVCPGCVKVLPKRNAGCPACGYQDHQRESGRISTVREIMNETTGTYENVSPAFIRAVVEAAQAETLV